MRKAISGTALWLSRIAFCFLALTCADVTKAQSWSNTYAFRRTVTVDHTKVPNTDQANFPFCFRARTHIWRRDFRDRNAS